MEIDLQTCGNQFEHSEYIHSIHKTAGFVNCFPCQNEHFLYATRIVGIFFIITRETIAIIFFCVIMM